MKSFVPIAVATRSVIIRAKCIRRQGKPVKNARATAKRVAVVNKQGIMRTAIGQSAFFLCACDIFIYNRRKKCREVGEKRSFFAEIKKIKKIKKNQKKLKKTLDFIFL